MMAAGEDSAKHHQNAVVLINAQGMDIAVGELARYVVRFFFSRGLVGFN